MTSIDDAVTVLTDPRNLSEVDGPPGERRFAVKQKQVIARLREAGAGKAEARTLALQAVEKVGGEITEGSHRGAPMARHTDSTESWVIPLEAVRWDTGNAAS
jgi:hypothetical protein